MGSTAKQLAQGTFAIEPQRLTQRRIAREAILAQGWMTRHQSRSALGTRFKSITERGDLDSDIAEQLKQVTIEGAQPTPRTPADDCAPLFKTRPFMQIPSLVCYQRHLPSRGLSRRMPSVNAGDPSSSDSLAALSWGFTFSAVAQ